MNADDLIEEVRDELHNVERVVGELQSLTADVEGRHPTLREKMAAGGFLSSFYMGVENVLKRICKFREVPLPQSARWHIALFERFCPPAHEALPVLFNEELAREMKPYREFRHVARHGYGLDLNWELMQDGMANVESVFERFRGRVDGYLETLPS